MGEFQWDVFLSHSNRDADVVRELAEKLRGDGLRVWLDADEIKPGDNIHAKLTDGLEQSRVLVAVLSKNFTDSEWTRYESGIFLFRDPVNSQRRFVPVRLDDSPLRPTLAAYAWVDWSQQDVSEYSRLVESCRGAESAADAESAGKGDKDGGGAGQSDGVDDIEPTLLCTLRHGLFARVFAVAISGDGRRVITAGERGFLKVWDVYRRNWTFRKGKRTSTLEGHTSPVWSVALTPDGSRAVSGSADNTLRVWDVERGVCTATLEGHGESVMSVALTPDGSRAVSGSADNTLRVWDVERGVCTATLERHTSYVRSVALTPDGSRAVSGSEDNTLRVWDVERGVCTATLEGHTSNVLSVALTPDGSRAVSGSADHTLRVWDLDSGVSTSTLEGHKSHVWSVALTPDRSRAVSGSDDNTLRVWDLERGVCTATLEGHTGTVRSVALTPDGSRAVSGSDDNTMRVWDLERGVCTATFEGHTSTVRSVALTPDGSRTISGSRDKTGKVWEMEGCSKTASSNDDKIQDNRGDGRELAARGQPTTRYTNAKVLLVGESGVGKTGLARRMSTGEFEATQSTDGHWATRLKASHVDEEWATRVLLEDHVTDDGVRREIWLWDFAGQADYRLIHQLFMDETTLAVLVFNPQQEDLFNALARWDIDLTRASRKQFRKLLVAGRIDVGRLLVPRSDIDRFVESREFDGYLETSAANGHGCQELVNAICNAIDWDGLTKTVSNVTFDRLKSEILKLRDMALGGEQHRSLALQSRAWETLGSGEPSYGGSVLIRQADLHQRLPLTAPDLDYEPAELSTVIGHLAAPGLVWKLDFGDYVLLQPERINTYAAAVVRQLRSKTNQLGIIAEHDILAGRLDFGAMERLPEEDESVVLQAMHHTFVDRGLCIREPTGRGPQLVFPAFFNVEVPENPELPPLFEKYAFSGFLDDIYATLVVRLNYAQPFQRQKLWKDYADFRSQSGQRMGIELKRGREGKGELLVYMEDGTPNETRVVFSRYVHDHLQEKSGNLTRARQYVCGACGEPFANFDVVLRVLAKGNGDPKVFCEWPECRTEIRLRDKIEEMFHSPEYREMARKLTDKSKAAIAAESTEVALLRHAEDRAHETRQVFQQYDEVRNGLFAEIILRGHDDHIGERKILIHVDNRPRDRMADRHELFDERGELSAARLTDGSPWLSGWRKLEHAVMWVYRKPDGSIWWLNPTPRSSRLEWHEELTAWSLHRLRQEIIGPPPARIAT